MKGNVTIVETMQYFKRELWLPDYGIIGFMVAVNLALTLTIWYSTHTAVCDRSFWQRLALLQSRLSGTAIATAITPVSQMRAKIKTPWTSI